MSSEPEISVVMPAYNLEHIIVDSVLAVCKALNGLVESYEIIVVDDGSEDNTYDAVLGINNKHVRVLKNGVNEGKGSAIKKGVFFASGRYTIILDADMEIDPIQIRTYLRLLKKADVVIASKKHRDSVYEAPFIRKFLSWGFNILVQMLTGLRIRDTQTGLKAFRTDALKSIMNDVLVKRYAFDVEVLVLANLLGLKVIEAPVKVRVKCMFSFKDVIRMLLDLLGLIYRLKIIRWYQQALKEKKLSFTSKFD